MSSTTSRYELATINTTVVSDHSAASTPSSCLSTWEDVSPTSITSSSPVLVAGPTVMRIHGSVKPACKVKTFVSKHAMARSVASVTQRTGDFVTIKLEGDSDHIIELRSLIEEHVRTTAPQSVVTWDEPTPDELRHPLFSGVVILPSEHSNNLRKQSNEFLTGDISTYQENDAPPRYPEVGMSATKSVGDAVKEGIKLHGAGITAAVQSAVASVLTPARAIEAVGNADIGFGAAVGGLIYTAAATPAPTTDKQALWRAYWEHEERGRQASRARAEQEEREFRLRKIKAEAIKAEAEATMSVILLERLKREQQ